MKRKLQENELRVLKIDSRAVYEFLCESMMEKGADFFDLHDITKVEFNFSCQEDGTFFCAVSKRGAYQTIDFSAVERDSDLTTESLFSRKRYRSVFVGKASN